MTYRIQEENPKTNYAMHAYIIMLHLRSQGWTNFTEIWKLFCWEAPKNHFVMNCVGYIDVTIDRLREEWGEDIPKINAFVFKKETECTSYICRNVFRLSEGEQPPPKEIAAHAAAIAAYPKWDKVIEVLRHEAFEAADGVRRSIK